MVPEMNRRLTKITKPKFWKKSEESYECHWCDEKATLFRSQGLLEMCEKCISLKSYNMPNHNDLFHKIIHMDNGILETNEVLEDQMFYGKNDLADIPFELITIQNDMDVQSISSEPSIPFISMDAAEPMDFSREPMDFLPMEDFENWQLFCLNDFLADEFLPKEVAELLHDSDFLLSPLAFRDF